MAFTSAQATDIRHSLGYPQVYRYANPRLESAIVVVGGDADATAKAISILAKISAVLTAQGSTGLVSAGVKSLDKGDVELYGNGQTAVDLATIGRRAVAELSILFGVPIANDIFGESGYSGDHWKAQNGRPTLTGLG